MTVAVVSSDAEARAAELAELAADATAWLADVLREPSPVYRLYVLNRDDWPKHAKADAYGLPHATYEGDVVVSSEPADLFDPICEEFWPDFSEATRDSLRRTYGDPPRLDAFADLILVHELGHLFEQGRFERLWQTELYANLAAVAYLATQRPSELPTFTTFARAGVDVPPSRVAVSRLEEMGRSLETGPTNYVWYELRLTTAAEELWRRSGVDAFRALHGGDLSILAELERSWP
jgi:hypothetical protein